MSTEYHEEHRGEFDYNTSQSNHNTTRQENDQSDIEQLDEGYWSALLNEGEYSHVGGQHVSINKVSSNNTPESASQNHIYHNKINQPHSEDMHRYQDGDSPHQDLYNDHIALNEHTYHDNDSDYLEEDWDDIAIIMDDDKVLHLNVIGYNRGGLLVEWHSLRGFVPASQLIDFPTVQSVYERQNTLIKRVGTSLFLRVIELDRDKNRLILSERAAQVESGTRADILQKLNPGTVVTGIITNLCDFGAFVDLGGVEGLIHISELSWGRVGHPADILSRDQEVQVFVLDVDPEEARIALSLKRLHADPWVTVADRYTIGEIVEGTITNVVDFGAFACIEEGLEGLIHFSELAEGHFLHPRNVVAEGDVIHARILSINGQARRLGLSLRTL